MFRKPNSRLPRELPLSRFDLIFDQRALVPTRHSLRCTKRGAVPQRCMQQIRLANQSSRYISYRAEAR